MDSREAAPVRRGRFLTLEGTEGVGKSTQLAAVADLLSTTGLAVRTTREPGGTATAERIRQVLLTPESGDPLPPMAELLLMFAARDTHVTNLVEPSLARGEWVVCDRFTDATLAYQGAGRGLPVSTIRTLAQWVHGELQPDCTLLLDAPVEVGMARARARSGTDADRFERETIAFFERVRTAYLALAAAEPQRFVVIDATTGPTEVTERIRGALTERYGLLDAGAGGVGRDG
jgi:dTMP kinase